MSAGHPGGPAEPGEGSGAPPSTAGFFEPYGARVLFHPSDQGLEADRFLTCLLEGVAAGCVAEGASVIGHLKCLMRAGDRRLRCNLTSARLGATCRGEAGVVSLAIGAELDLAVLVYGIPAITIDHLVGVELHRLLDPDGVGWSKQASFHSSRSAGGGHGER